MTKFDNSKFWNYFVIPINLSIIFSFHSAFYTNNYNKDDIDTAFKHLKDFLSELQKVELNEDQKTKIIMSVIYVCFCN